MSNVPSGSGGNMSVAYGYNGNVLGLVNTSGNVVANYEYDPFGNFI